MIEIKFREGNKLIAVFMGAEEEITQVAMSTIGNAKAPTGRIYFPNRNPDNMHLCLIEDLRYHTSWDWLNPAWKRFLAYADELLYKDEKYKYDTFRIYHNCVDNDNCEAAMFHLADRIKWYNIQKQPQ